MNNITTYIIEQSPDSPTIFKFLLKHQATLKVIIGPK